MAIDTIARQPVKFQGPGNYYRPRALVRLDIPIGAAIGDATGGEVVTVLAYVRRFDLLSNSHIEADTCTIVVDWQMAGVDPRLISDAVVVLYVGQADLDDRYVPTDDDIRFVGILKRAKRSGGEEDGLTVEILAHDYTTLFLGQKHFDARGVPVFSDTLTGAWQKICSYVGYPDPNDPTKFISRVESMKTAIRFVGGARDTLLGTAVSGRFASIGKVQVKQPSTDAWAVWQQCVGMCGLISYIRLGECIVTLATDYYTVADPPRLLWGSNIKSLVEDRDTSLGSRGVVLTSFDPLTATSLEAYYPPIGDKSVRKKVISAKKASSEAKVLNAEDREYFAYPSVTTQDALNRVARSVYEQRARQELEGRVTLHEMSINTVGGAAFDLLNLQSGDSIRIEVDQSDTEALGQFSSDGDKVNYLVGLGYDPGLASVVVANMRGILALAPIYMVKRVNTQLDSSPEGGNFAIEITYTNKILPSGTSA